MKEILELLSSEHRSTPCARDMVNQAASNCCRLSELQRGESGIVREIEHHTATGQRLLAMGFLPGCRLTFVKNAPLGDPMMVQTSAGVICLRRREAGLVWVERTK